MELKAFNCVESDLQEFCEPRLVYLKSDVDKMIAELKDKCQMHDFFWEGCGFAKRGFKNTIAVSEAFDRLETEIRKLKRALWVTRTAMAKFEKDRWDAFSDCGNKRNRKDPAWVKTGKLLETSEWRKLWADNERKCRAKAEQYEEDK